ncbi:hypothetical protein V9T40_011137 [Parthenolecanium corni]|uniref:SOCS box domain-containing protein n=1 Tax=Parthenolecanium corni TaxID=536013 RepID=A0AAN9TJE5_9HEMI
MPADPISCSILLNDINALLQLLEGLKRNRSPLPANSKNWTALHYAASQPQCKRYLKLVLEYSDSILMDINGLTDDGTTALHIACENCCEESVLILLQKGCDPYKVTSDDHDSALHIAAGKGNSKIIEYLLNHPENINKPNKWGFTPLHQARNLEVGRILLEKGADVRSINHDGNLPLHCASENDNLDMIQFLVECDLTLINCTNFKGCTPLMLAAKRGADVCGVRILCENGAKIDIFDECGWTTLHYAAKSGKFEVLEYILQYIETSCFEACFSNKLNNVLNAKSGRFVSLTCASIDLIRNEKCLEVLLSSNKLSQSILQAPNIVFKDDFSYICSPLAYLFRNYQWARKELVNSHLQLLIKYNIIMLDEFSKVYEVEWPKCDNLGLECPFGNILRDRDVPLSKIQCYFHLLNANDITIDYCLQCYHDNNQSFATFTNYERYYEPVMYAVWLYGTEILKLILPNSAILEPDELIPFYHKIVNRMAFDDGEAGDFEFEVKEKYHRICEYLTSLKPIYYKQPKEYDRNSFLLYPFNTIGEEFSKSTLQQLCRTVIRQHLREPTLEGNLRNFQRKILQLPLPTFLKDYLFFKH